MKQKSLLQEILNSISMPSEDKFLKLIDGLGKPLEAFTQVKGEGLYKKDYLWLILLNQEIQLVHYQDESIRILKSLARDTRIKTSLTRSPGGITCRFIQEREHADSLTISIPRMLEKPLHRFIQVLETGRAKETNLYAQFVNDIEAPLSEVQSNHQSGNWMTLRRLIKEMYQDKRLLYPGFICAILASVLSIIPPYLTGKIVDEIIIPIQTSSPLEGSGQTKMYLFLAVLAGVFIAKEICEWVRLRRMSILAENVAKNLRSQVFAHLQKLDIDFFSAKSSGALISRISSDSDRLWDFMAMGLTELFVASISLMGMSLFLLSLDLKLGLILSLSIPIFLFSIYRHGEKMQRVFAKAWNKWSRVTNVLSDTLPGMSVVKAFGQEHSELAKFDSKNNDATDEFNQLHDYWTKFWPCLMLSIHMTTVLIWLFAIPRLTLGQDDPNYLSSGSFVAFLLYMTMFTKPIEIMGQMSRVFNRAISSATRVFEILDTPVKMRNGIETLESDQVAGEIEFKNVSFSYDGIRPILCSVNFKVKPGETIGLVGPTGGGKSTITKLINRFHDPSFGEILIDGKPIQNLKTWDLRKLIGVVHQTPHLFQTSIFENIRYGNPSADHARVIRAAAMANAHEFILKLEKGYETIIGENGHTLSGGEKQRISIARAILNDPKILILDEATSAVDNKTEKSIQKSLDELAKGRTVFVIAHRLSTLRKADRIFYVENGSIAEEGSPKKLLGNPKSLYYQLVHSDENLEDLKEVQNESV